MTSSQTSQIPTIAEPGSLSSAQSQRENEIAQFPQFIREEEELVEQDLRERFKRMCEGYFDNVCTRAVFALSTAYTAGGAAWKAIGS